MGRDCYAQQVRGERAVLEGSSANFNLPFAQTRSGGGDVFYTELLIYSTISLFALRWCTATADGNLWQIQNQLRKAC